MHQLLSRVLLMLGNVLFFAGGLRLGYDLGWEAHTLIMHGKRLDLRRILWRRLTRGVIENG